MERTAEFCCLLNRILLVTFASLLCSHATMSLTIINLSWGRLGSAQKNLGAPGFNSHLEGATHEKRSTRRSLPTDTTALLGSAGE